MLLVACGDSDAPDATESGSTAGIAPLEGDRLSSTMVRLDNGCGVHSDGLDGTEAAPDTRRPLGDDVFTLLDDSLRVADSLDRISRLSCAPLEDILDFKEDGVDVVSTWSLTGTVDSPTSGSQSTDVTVPL